MSEAGIDNVVSEVGKKYLQLHLTADVGPVRLRNLLAHFCSLEAVLSASMAELERVPQVGARVAEAIFRSRPGDDVEREVERAAENGVRILCQEDSEYPAPLRNIVDPPICLYVRGSLRPTDVVSVGIVGTRRCSHYGREQALRFAEMLGGAGFTIISGLARGIDGHAHYGALQAGGRTVAVLGNGLGTVYPPEHAQLAEDISGAGALVSEFAVDIGPDAKNFPRRNRIIAGLSLGVLVIEAGKTSGALITARLAADYNREVFALPGRVDQPATTAGVHSLIRDGGAKLVTCLDDILDELAEVGEIMRIYGPTPPAKRSVSAGAQTELATELQPHERAVWEAVSAGTETVDGIGARSQLAPAEILPALTSLQIKGMIRQLPGGSFAVRRR